MLFQKGPLDIMKITRACLLGIHPTLAAIIPDLEISPDTDSSIAMYLPGGTLWGRFTLQRFVQGIPEFWKKHAEHCYFQRIPDNLGPYTLNFSVVLLNISTLPELIQLKSHFPDRLNELYSAMFPPPPHRPEPGRHSHPSILFCQPGACELTRPSEEIASDGVRLMGFDHCAVLAASLNNALFAAGPYGFSGSESVGAFALEQPPDEYIRIPRIVYDLLLYQGLIFILQDLHRHASKITFVEKSVAEYLSGLRQNQRRSRPYSQQFLRFLQDWENASQKLKTIEDVARLVDAELTTNGFARAHSTSVEFRVRMPPVFRGSVINLITRDYDNAALEVKNDLTIGSDRQKSIGDYLRDAANSEATLINLRLQRLVIWLAFFTVLVGILALGTGLLTEEQKKNLWHGHAKESNPLPTQSPTMKPAPSRQ